MKKKKQQSQKRKRCTFAFWVFRATQRTEKALKRHKLHIIARTLCRQRNKVLRQPCLDSFTAIKFTSPKVASFCTSLRSFFQTMLCASIPIESSIEEKKANTIFSHVDFVKRQTNEALPIAPYTKFMFLTLLLPTFFLSDEKKNMCGWSNYWLRRKRKRVIDHGVIEALSHILEGTER